LQSFEPTHNTEAVPLAIISKSLQALCCPDNPVSKDLLALHWAELALACSNNFVLVKWLMFDLLQLHFWEYCTWQRPDKPRQSSWDKQQASVSGVTWRGCCTTFTLYLGTEEKQADLAGKTCEITPSRPKAEEEESLDISTTFPWVKRRKMIPP